MTATERSSPAMPTAISNILDNAVRYSPIGGEIVVSCEATAGSAIIRNTDNGPGIRDEDLPHLFKRFYRSAKSGGEGSGLGLALADSIVLPASGA